MNLENQLLEKFQVEELEKRFELGHWTKKKGWKSKDVYCHADASKVHWCPQE